MKTVLLTPVFAMAIAAMVTPTAASAEVTLVAATGNSQSEACTKAKNSARSSYGKRIVRWSPCQCSDRGVSDQYDFRDRYHCSIDVHLKD